MEVLFSPLDALIPIIVALVKQTGFPAKWNALLALAVYVVWTGVTLFTGIRATEGEVTLEVFAQALITAATTGFISYQLFWKSLGEQRLEAATTIAKGPESDPIPAEPEDAEGGNG